MKKILIYCSFIIACSVIIAAFITSTSYLQLGIAILLYPVLVYFALKLFPRKPVIPIRIEIPKSKREDIDIVDIDKRLFLKLIGAAGLTFFLSSLFAKRVEPLFLGRAAGPGTTDSTQRQPTDGYRITEIDEGVVTYSGFTNTEGAWYIMRGDTEKGSFRYTKGDSNFPGNWNSREKLNYDYFNKVF